MKTDTKDELRLANALLTEHIVNMQDRITSLESHNRELLAVNQVLREALKGAKEFFDSDGDISCRSEMMIATAVRNAVDIKPGDIALIEVGTFHHMEYSVSPNIEHDAIE